MSISTSGWVNVSGIGELMAGGGAFENENEREDSMKETVAFLRGQYFGAYAVNRLCGGRQWQVQGEIKVTG